MKREKQLYRETFVKGTKFDEAVLPRVKHTERDHQPVEMHLLARGTVQRGDEELSYHDVRLYFK